MSEPVAYPSEVTREELRPRRPKAAPRSRRWSLGTFVFFWASIALAGTLAGVLISGASFSSSRSAPAMAANTLHWPGTDPIIDVDPNGSVAERCADGLTTKDIGRGRLLEKGADASALTYSQQISSVDDTQTSITFDGNVPKGVALEGIILHVGGTDGQAGMGADIKKVLHIGPRGVIDQTYYDHDIPENTGTVGLGGGYSYSGMSLCLYDPNRLLP
jgi:hypothetical protein